MSSNRKRVIHWDFFSLMDNNKIVKCNQELAYHSLATAMIKHLKCHHAGAFVSQCHETRTKQFLFSCSKITFLN